MVILNIIIMSKNNISKYFSIRNTRSKGGLFHKKYILKGAMILNAQIVKMYVTYFWNDVVNKVPRVYGTKDFFLMVIVKIRYCDKEMGYKSMAHLRKVTLSDKEAFANYLIARLGTLTESYHDSAIEEIIFSHMYVIGKKPDTQRLMAHPGRAGTRMRMLRLRVLANG